MLSRQSPALFWCVQLGAAEAGRVLDLVECIADETMLAGKTLRPEFHVTCVYLGGASGGTKKAMLRKLSQRKGESVPFRIPAVHFHRDLIACEVDLSTSQDGDSPEDEEPPTLSTLEPATPVGSSTTGRAATTPEFSVREGERASRVRKQSFPCENEFPHITIALAPGVSAVQSNQLVSGSMTGGVVRHVKNSPTFWGAITEVTKQNSDSLRKHGLPADRRSFGLGSGPRRRLDL